MCDELVGKAIESANWLTEIAPRLAVGRLYFEDVLQILHGFRILFFGAKNTRNSIERLY